VRKCKACAGGFHRECRLHSFLSSLLAVAYSQRSRLLLSSTTFLHSCRVHKEEVLERFLSLSLSFLSCICVVCIWLWLEFGTLLLGFLFQFLLLTGSLKQVGLTQSGDRQHANIYCTLSQHTYTYIYIYGSRWTTNFFFVSFQKISN